MEYHFIHIAAAQWAEDGLVEDEHFYRKFIFSDEAHYHLCGYVNKQNCRIGSHVTMEKLMHPQRVAVWCGMDRRHHWSVFLRKQGRSRQCRSFPCQAQIFVSKY